MSNEFFMAMVPPTVTHQEKQVRVAGGKPVFYEPPELKAARQKLVAYLGQHVPDEPYHCGVRLITKWCFPRGKHLDGTYRLSKPDTDNLQKLLKDCMTKVGFWDDDDTGGFGNCGKVLGGSPWDLCPDRQAAMIWLTPQERKALWEEYPEVQEMYEEYNGILPEGDGAWERVAEHCHQIREQYQTMQVEVALQDVVWQLECLAKRKRGD